MWRGPSVHVQVPLAVSPANLSNLGAYVRDIYKVQFQNELDAGSIKPLVLPYAVLGSYLLPILYFSIPHVNRPWLYRARFPLFFFIVAFNIYEALSSSSTNFAIAYAVGLMQGWGILWSATMMLWMRPQFEAERVEKRKRVGAAGDSALVNGHGHGHGHGIEANVNGNGNGNGIANGNEHEHESGNGNGNGHATANGMKATRTGNVTVRRLDDGRSKVSPSVSVADAPDEDVARSLAEGYEYYWQAYPATAPWTTRLEWSTDLFLSFRGTGWNWGAPVIPHFAKAEKPLTGSLVDLASIPLVTRQGYRRYKTSQEWVQTQIVPAIISFLILDVVGVLMSLDPYFILGPEFISAAARSGTPVSLPPYLDGLSSSVLFTYRAMTCFIAMLIVINLVMTAWQMVAHFVLGPNILGTRAELWHMASAFGSFTTNVLDKGMVGFWGGWWHQTFRSAFSAPGIWLSRNGYIDPRSASGKAVAGFFAFAQSGLLHAFGSMSSLPPTRPWQQMNFFLLCWLGVLVQTVMAAAARPLTKHMPLWVRRAGNLALVCAWLIPTQNLLSDDLGRAGVCMIEPVLVSPLRAMGFGKPGDSWIRWDAIIVPQFHVGKTWWQSGITFQ